MAGYDSILNLPTTRYGHAKILGNLYPTVSDYNGLGMGNILGNTNIYRQNKDAIDIYLDDEEIKAISRAQYAALPKQLGNVQQEMLAEANPIVKELQVAGITNIQEWAKKNGISPEVLQEKLKANQFNL